MTLRRFVILLFLITLALPSFPASEDNPVTGPIKLVYDSDFPDPYVIRHGDYFYVTGSWPRMLRTKSFEPGDIMAYTMDIDLGPDKKKIDGYWAMRLYCHTDGSWHAYASVHYLGFRTLVAHFSPAPGEKWTDEKPITRWTLDKVLIGDLKLGLFAYDSVVLRDDNGALWMLYSSGSPNEVLGVDIHVKARRMIDPLNFDPASPVYTILSPEGIRSENRNENFVQILEGPIPVKLGKWWGLSYSAGDFTAPNYKTTFAFSDQLVPTLGKSYEKLVIPDAKNTWKNDGLTTEVLYTLQSETDAWPNYVGKWVEGPGHANLVEINGKHFLIFHGRKLRKDMTAWDGRSLWKAEVDVKVGENTPRDQWIVPKLE